MHPVPISRAVRGIAVFHCYDCIDALKELEMVKLKVALRFAVSALVVGGALNTAALASEILIDRGLPVPT